MNLDVNTPKGQESVQHENFMLKYIHDCWNVDIIKTNKHDSAICDGFLTRNKIIVGLFESKCRNLSYEELETYGSWLITNEKIKICRKLSKYLKVPFIGFLYLIKSNITMYWIITDKNGEYKFEIQTANTETQKTINGGSIIRENAYLPFTNGEILTKIKQEFNN
jgi:hypothetical protein